MRRLPVADACWAAAVVTLPLVGVGTVHLLTGRDPGTGLPPAYLALALAWLLRLADLLRPAGTGARRRLAADPRLPAAGRWLALLAVVLGLSALGLVAAPAPLLPHEAWPRWGRQVLQVAVVAAFAVYPALWLRGPRRWRAVTGWLALAAAVEVAYAVLQGVHGVRALPLMGWLEGVVTSNPGLLAGSEKLYLGGYTAVPRLRGTMLEPLYLGSFLLLAVPWLVATRRRTLAGLALVVLLGTWSRAAWLAAAGAVVVWLVARRRAGLPGGGRRAVVLAGGGLAGLAAAVALVAGPEALLWPARRLLQVADASDWSNLTRYYSLQAAWRAFLESPLVGVGWGQYPYHFYALVDLPGLESQFTWPVVNSLPLRVLCETGVLGATAAAVAAGVLLGRTWRALGSSAPAGRRARLATAATAGVGVGLQLLMFSQYQLPHLWVALGLWIAALAEARRARGGRGGPTGKGTG
jgi:O-antigen ligase